MKTSVPPSDGQAPGSSRRVAPFLAVQTVTFLGSLGTGVVTSGIFFLAQEACGFTVSQNFALGLFLGLSYILGAAGIGPALRRLARRSSAVSTRSVLVTLSACMGLVSFVPQWAAWRSGDTASVGWAIWLVVAVYAPASGAFWPLVESYLSGGRRGASLRTAIGRFNIVWGVAVVTAFWAMAPLLEHRPLVLLSGFGVLQLACTAVVWRLGREPGRHLAEHHEPHPEVYERLLATFRVLLPTSYYITAVWSPYAPTALDRLDVPIGWQAPVVATWMMSRVATFAVLERWHGWQGRWSAATAGGAGMIGGIVLSLLAPALGTEAGVPLMLLGLALLGIGNGIVYTAALYYALEVGRGEVEAGGAHESLIGLGFAGGPATGLAASGLVAAGAVGAERLNLTIIGLLTLVLLLIGVYAFVRMRSAPLNPERGGLGSPPSRE